MLAHGDTAAAPRLLAQLPRPLRPDSIVADLPYGVQHAGAIEELLARGLPAWHQVTKDGAVLGLARDATRLPRQRFVEWVEEWVEADGVSRVLRGGAWEKLAHPVDRAIKRRDVVVAQRSTSTGVAAAAPSPSRHAQHRTT